MTGENVVPFKKGESGNPGGRAKGSQNKDNESPVHEAFRQIVKKKPWLLTEAFERGLEGRKASVYLELGAKLGREIGGDDEGQKQVIIIMNSPLDAGALREGLGPIKVIDTKPIKALVDESPMTELEAAVLEEDDAS